MSSKSSTSARAPSSAGPGCASGGTATQLPKRCKDALIFERFTDRARRVLVLAQEEARLLNHGYIGTEHILLGLIHEGDGLAAKTLESLDISLEAVRSRVEERIGPPQAAPTGSPPFTPRAKKVLELSLREALQMGHNYIGTEHLLLGLVREGEGVGAQVLVSLGVELPRVRQQVIELLTGYQGRTPAPRGGIGRHPQARIEIPAVPVGREWTAQVVRTGRRPDDYERGYAELAGLVEGFGLVLDDLEASEITLTSIETTEGPGFMIRVEHRIEDEGVGAGYPPPDQ
ncbi:MAG TPA: Clp protease N-terminal domain-containing protein [Acidimicrobiales bacterium]|nr:Clp protease N-terminal domain-containing protein [Acidimicrobiales bacterium]